MAGRLTTHVLDTANGVPARGMQLDLVLVHGDHSHHIATVVTDADGRTEKPLLDDTNFQPGTYELWFHVGTYFQRMGLPQEKVFLDAVPVRFTLQDEAHYHVPLLASPFSYSTYRGS